jgi:prefoldin subunit 5
MERDIQEKQAKIKELQDSIDTINTAKKDAETFMENISKLI